MKIFHAQQKMVWENEHKNPCQLTSVAGVGVSGGVREFWKYFRSVVKADDVIGLEIGCGKGRNVIWLATQGANMEGFDFSHSAIEVAKKKVRGKLKKRAHFFEHDIIKTWPFQKDYFDFAIDCFVSTDVEGVRNRKFMIEEAYRVLKPGGYFFLYTNSVKSDFYKYMVTRCKVDEVNAFCYPDIKKFEKVYTQKELDKLYGCFKLKESKVFKRNSFVDNKPVCWEHIWRVYQKK